MVLEFKPNNNAAKAQGEDQLDRYRPAVAKYYQSHINNGTTPESTKGGSAIIDILKKKCMSGKSIEFGRKVETYDMCEQKYECVE